MKGSMKPLVLLIRKAFLPAGVFVAVFVVHYLYFIAFPEQDPAQTGWVVVPKRTSFFQEYIEAQRYWLGYAYGLPIAFAAVALRSYRQSRCRASRNLALGGVAFSGFLAAVVCFVIGCCGSPMVVVWLTLFGVACLPLAKPLVAVLTTVSVGAAWWWMRRKMVRMA
jgi:uncharacterized membrane protein YozB (DUF420 family)